MMRVQSRGGSQVLGSGVGELIEDGEVGGADLEVEDGVLDHAWWRTAPGASEDHSPRTPHDTVTRVTDFGHSALPEGHHLQPAERFESSRTSVAIRLITSGEERAAAGLGHALSRRVRSSSVVQG